eukprot:SAG22_NODE_2175_length_2886_cov_2.073197_2_plen_272_part_00
MTLDDTIEPVSPQWWFSTLFLSTIKIMDFQDTAGNAAMEVASTTTGQSVTLCPPGQFGVSGSRRCAPCQAGRFDDDLDPATECLACPPGKYVASTGQVQGCLECSAGTYSSSGWTACVICENKYSYSGAENCSQCPTGTEPNAPRMATDCRPCPITTFGPDGISCRICPAGFTSIAEGQSACSQCSGGAGVGGTCKFCEPGEEPTTDLTGCLSCELGRYSWDGGDCTLCNAGTQPNTVFLATECVACDVLPETIACAVNDEGDYLHSDLGV